MEIASRHLDELGRESGSAKGSSAFAGDMLPRGLDLNMIAWVLAVVSRKNNKKEIKRLVGILEKCEDRGYKDYVKKHTIKNT